MPNPTRQLRWIPRNVAKAMRDNGIQDRNQAAKTLKVGRSTVYSAFGPDWSGVATHGMLAAVAGAFDVSIATLAEPVDADEQAAA